MTLKKILEEKNMSIYRLAKMTGISYTCLNELANGKRLISEVSSGNLRRIADALEMRMDLLYDDLIGIDIVKFENFKSNVCHKLKEMGAEEFLIDLISNETVEKYWNQNQKLAAMYLVGMADFLCKKKKLPQNNAYDMYRSFKLSEPLYPMSLSVHFKNTDEKPEIPKDAIPEFLKFNIVEGDVFNVC